MELIVTQLSSITRSSVTDDSLRRTLLSAAQKLVNELELPQERTFRMVWRDPNTIIAIKVCLDLSVFPHLDDGQKSSAELAQGTGADSLLLSRLLRLLATQNI